MKRAPAALAFYFVSAVWAVSALLAVAYVVRYGGNVPFLDEWEFVPWLTETEGPLGKWLWTFHNEHRIVLTKLLFLFSKTLFGNDFRVPLFFDALAMALLGAASLRAVARWRGRLLYTDALIPLLLLHWGHAEVFGWGITSQFVISSGLLIVVMLLAWRPANEWTTGSVALAGLCLAGLPVSGANGIALVPSLLVWSVGSGFARVRDARRRRTGWILLVASATSLLLLGLYLFDLSRHALPHSNPGASPTLATIARFLGMSLGPIGSAIWPVGALLVGLLTASAVGLLVRNWRRQPEARSTSGGLLAGIGAVLSLAVAIGWGRAHIADEPGHALRYSTLAAPILLLVYMSWARYGRGSAGAFARGALFVMACAAFAFGFLDGSAYGRSRAEIDSSFERDALMGRSSLELAERYGGYLFWGDRQLFAERIEMLRRSEWGPFGFDPDRSVARLAALNRPVFPMISPPPYHVQSAIEVGTVDVSGRDVLVIHAPGVMRIRIPPGRYLLRGEYGMLPEAGASDGVRFRIGLGKPRGSETKLWSAFMDPARLDGQPFQRLEVELVADEPSDLIFRTLPGPRRNQTQDRAFWTAIDLRKQRP